MRTKPLVLITRKTVVRSPHKHAINKLLDVFFLDATQCCSLPFKKGNSASFLTIFHFPTWTRYFKKKFVEIINALPPDDNDNFQKRSTRTEQKSFWFNVYTNFFSHFSFFFFVYLLNCFSFDKTNDKLEPHGVLTYTFSSEKNSLWEEKSFIFTLHICCN